MESTQKTHESSIRTINKTNIDKAFVKGNNSFNIQKTFKIKKGGILYNKFEIIKFIQKYLNTNDHLMIKASNATGFKHIVKNIKDLK